MSRLLNNSPQFRDPLLSKNTFNSEDTYNIANPRALSDGDEHGKGETNTIGSATDIAKRNQLQAKNLYNNNKPYDLTNV